MIESIKITNLNNIGSNLSYTSIFPVVDMSGTPVTDKANLQIIGNYILSQAGGANFVQAAQATLAQTVVNAAQPNITSVGTLTALNVSGNLNISVSNLKVSGGTNGYVLQTDGNGNLTWTAQTGGGGNGSPGGANTQIQFNDAGSFGGDAGLTFNKTTDTLTTGNISASNVELTGNVSANWVIGDYVSGNAHNLFYIPGANVNGTVPSATTAGTVTTAAQPNITSIGTLSNLSVTGNVTAGNVDTSNIKSAGNINVTANVLTWLFDNTGALHWPGGIGQIDTNNSTFEIHSTNGLQISTNEANSAQSFLFATDGSVYCPANAYFEGTRLNVGPGAGNVPLTTNPTLVVTDTGLEYIQAALINQSPNGSSDYAAYGADSDETQGFADLGFTGHTFNDPNYTITNPGDGYILSQGYANGIGGSLVLATGALGNTPDIVFATGGFLASNEFARIDHSNNVFHLTRANSGIQFADGTIQTTAAISYGNSNVTSLLGAFGSNNIVTTGNVTANYFVGVATDVSVGAVNNNYSYHMAFVTDSGDTTLHMDADDNLQYNPADGTMTVTRVDSGYLSVTQSVISNLNPLSNVTQDLGNTTNRWKDIWLANSTIHLGDATITANGNSIVVDSITVTDGNVGTIGNVASLNLDGSNSNVLYGNGVFAPASGGGGNVSELVNGNNSFVLDSTGNVVFEGTPSGNAVNRGLVWDYGANANGVNSELRQDMFGVTLRAWTENGGGANGFSAPLRIVTNQDAAENVWLFDDLGNLTLPGNINAINDGGQLGAQVLLQPDLGKARLAARTLQYTQNFNSGSWTSASYTGTQVDILDDPNLVNFVSNNTIFTSAVDRTFSINGNEPVPYQGYGASGNNVTLYTSITADPDPTVVTSIDFYYQSESYFGIDYDDGGLDMIAAGLTINIDNDQTQGPDINLRSGDDITLQAKNKSLGSESEGGDINIYAGDGASDDGQGNTASTGGDIQIEAGQGGDGNSSSGSAGGFTTLRAGAGGQAGATNTAGSGGYVEIRGGNGGSDGGNTALGAGGGYVSITAGSSTQEGVNGATVSISSGSAGPNALAGNVEIFTPASGNGPGGTWRFDGNGLLSLPGDNVKIGSQYGSEAILASNVAFGVVSQGTSGMTALQWTDDVSNTSQFSAVYINDSTANVGDIQIRTGAVGNANIWKFGNDGNLTLPSNTFAVNYANGTQVSLGGGGNTGNVTFDNVTVQGVNGLNLSAGSDFTANLAYLQVRAGDVASHIHLDTGNNQAYDLIVGDDQNYVQVSSTGNILLSAYDSNTSQYTWTLDYNGNLILAGGNSVIQSIANSSLDPLNPNVSTMALTPDANYSSQSLVLDPTAPGHIHLRSPGANIDEPYANLFLGGENTSFEVGAFYGATPNAYIHSGGNTWTFASDGNLIFPRDANINTDPYLRINGGATPTIISEDTSLAGPANLAIVSDYLTLQGFSESITIRNNDGTFSGSPNLSLSLNAYDDGDSPTVQLINWNSNSGFPTTIVSSEPDQVALTTNVSSPSPYSWTFDNAGTLTVPGNLVAAGASPAPSISGFSSVSALQFTNGNSNVTINANSNTWKFDSTGNLTIPGSSGGFIKTISNASIGIAAVDNGTNNPAQIMSINAGTGNPTTIISAYASNATIQSNVSGTINTWAFGADGYLTLPTDSVIQGTGNLDIFSGTDGSGNGSPLYIYTSSGNVFGGDLFLDSGAGGTGDGGDIYITGGAGNANVGEGGRINITGGSGNIGGDIDIVGGSSTQNPPDGGNVRIQSASYIWRFDNVGVATSPVLTYANLSAATIAGRRAFISDANLVAAGNFGNAVSGGGSNTVPVYSDGSVWRIG